jgi:hypothetical protein
MRDNLGPGLEKGNALAACRLPGGSQKAAGRLPAGCHQPSFGLPEELHKVATEVPIHKLFRFSRKNRILKNSDFAVSFGIGRKSGRVPNRNFLANEELT